MADNFVTCRHCGIGINYACDHEDDDVPAEEVAALRLALAEATKENETWRADVKLAAGELVGPVPEPGTDMARVCIANRLMRHERDEARNERAAVLGALDTIEGVLTNQPGDTPTPKDAGWSVALSMVLDLMRERDALLSRARETDGAVREAAERLNATGEEMARLDENNFADSFAALHVLAPRFIREAKALLSALSSPPRVGAEAPITCEEVGCPTCCPSPRPETKDDDKGGAA